MVVAAVPEKIACKPLVRDVNRAGGCLRVITWFPNGVGLGACNKATCRETGVLRIPW